MTAKEEGDYDDWTSKLLSITITVAEIKLTKWTHTHAHANELKSCSKNLTLWILDNVWGRNSQSFSSGQQNWVGVCWMPDIFFVSFFVRSFVRVVVSSSRVRVSVSSPCLSTEGRVLLQEASGTALSSTTALPLSLGWIWWTGMDLCTTGGFVCTSKK